MKLVPANGLIVAKYGDKKIDEVVKHAKCLVVRYKIQEDYLEYTQHNHKKDKNIVWTLSKGDSNKIYDNKNNLVLEFKTGLIGNYNLENILAVTTLIKNIFRYSDENKLVKVIEGFRGPKKRLEILHKEETLIVVDDFGVAPDRARNSINTLKDTFPEYKIISIFEPNSGSRISDPALFNSLYSETFKNSELVVIPDLSDLNSELVSTDTMTSRLKHLGFNTIHIHSDELESNIREIITNEYQGEKVLVVFFSSYRLTKIAERFSQQNLNN